MKENVVESHAVEQTTELARQLAEDLQPGDVVLLRGMLGAGKSVFARGIAKALGHHGWRGSPTFNLVHEYPGEPSLYHVDLYRLAPDEVTDLGLEEYARPDSILIVEWADRAAELVEPLGAGATISVELEHTGPESRLIRMWCRGERTSG